MDVSKYVLLFHFLEKNVIKNKDENKPNESDKYIECKVVLVTSENTNFNGLDINIDEKNPSIVCSSWFC